MLEQSYLCFLMGMIKDMYSSRGLVSQTRALTGAGLAVISSHKRDEKKQALGGIAEPID